MPYAMADIIKKIEYPPGVKLEVDSEHDRIVVAWPDGEISYITGRQIDDTNGRVKVVR